MPVGRSTRRKTDGRNLPVSFHRREGLEMIHDLLAACSSGYDLLIVYLAALGYSLQEIATATGDSKTGIHRRLTRIKKRIA